MANAESSLTPKSRAYQFAVANGFQISASCYNHRMTYRADHAAGSVEGSSYGSLLTRMQTLHAQFKAFLHQERQAEKARAFAVDYSVGPDSTAFTAHVKCVSATDPRRLETLHLETEYRGGVTPYMAKHPWQIVETIAGVRRIHFTRYASRTDAITAVRQLYPCLPNIHVERRV